MIDVTIDKELGAYISSRMIGLSFKRANSHDKFSAEQLERNIEYFLEHEAIHIIIDELFIDREYSDVVSWLFDYIDYSPRSVIRNHEIPERKILLSELVGLQSEHKRIRKFYLKKYLGKIVK